MSVPGNDIARPRSRAAFVTAPTQSSVSSTRDAPDAFLPAPVHRSRFTRVRFDYERHALPLLIIGVVALAVIPEMITHLNVKHSPDLPPLEADAAAEKFPLAHLASLALSAALLLITFALAVFRRLTPHRNVTGLLLLLLAFNVPYVLSPAPPAPADLPKILLANLFIAALWQTGAAIAELKWLPITITAVGVYSLLGGLVIPDFMMYSQNSIKAIIPGWELAGPFGHGNALGMYCAVAFALVPLVPRLRWQLFCGAVLFVTILASASRTSVIAAGIVLMWWAVCRFRSVVSIRLLGTVLASVTATAMLVFPFLAWKPDAWSGRASVWAASIDVWQHSPIVGLGVNWFLTEARWWGNIAVWAYVGTGHNLVVDTLVKSGIVGLLVLAPVLIGAIIVARRLPGAQQIAIFGFLIAFFVTASTEALWALLPNLQLYSVSGLIFSVVVLSQRGVPESEGTP